MRLGSTVTTYSQMTAVFSKMPSAIPIKSFRLFSSSPTFESSDVGTVVHASSSNEQSGGELCDTFAALNVATLHELGGGDALLEVCDSALMYLKRFRTCYEEELAGSNRLETIIPNSLSEALSVRVR